MASSNIILILLYLSPSYRTYYKATIKVSTSVERGHCKERNTSLSDICTTLVISHSVDWATFPSASLVADGSNTTAGVGTVYYKRLLPNVYLLWGQITPKTSNNAIALPHPSFSKTHAQVFTLYGAGMNSTKGFISNTDRSHIGFTAQNTGNTYALWGIAFLDESA